MHIEVSIFPLEILLIYCNFRFLQTEMNFARGCAIWEGRQVRHHGFKI